jgi:hypothetical protein
LGSSDSLRLVPRVGLAKAAIPLCAVKDAVPTR